MISRTSAIPLAFILYVPWVAGQTPILGVLEDVPGVYAGEPDVRRVRIVFQKNADDWIAFRSNCPDEACLKAIASEFPRKVTWNIGFDGKILGQLTANTPNEFQFYSHVGLQEITSDSSIPTIGKKSTEFGGFSGASSVYRPLVSNSEPYFSDPEHWKPVQLPPELAQRFRQQFRTKFPKLCRSSKDETKLEPFRYRDSDIGIVKTYASSKAWRIARLHVPDAIDCKDVEAGFQIEDSWFALDPHGVFHYLGRGMWLVDAGDYDNDGKSELVFAIDGDNRGGYEMFYADFTKHAIFEYGYH